MIYRVLALFTLVSSFTFPLREVKIKKPISDYTKLKASPITLESALIENYYNLQYIAELNFGTPGQAMTLTLDTGSSYTWVPSTSCDCHDSLNVFNSSLSSTYKNLTTKIELYYGMGEVKGYLVSDVLSLGQLSASNQTFVAITYDKDLDGLNSDGLLGLGFKELSDGVKTFVDNLKEQGKIKEAVFSFYLSNIDNEFRDSVFTIGEYDINLYGNGVEQIIDIDASYGYWLTILDKVEVDSSTVHNKQSYAIIDLGSSLISMPYSAFSNYAKKIKEINENCYDFGYLVCECAFGNYDAYPDITFTFGTEEFVIHPDNYIYYETGYCYLLIESSYESYYIIGQPFMRDYYTVFDMDNNLIRASRAVGTKETSDYGNLFYIICAGIFGFVVIVVGVFLIIYFTRKTNEDYQPLT